MKLELKDIRKSFGEKEILHGVSFAVESGRALGLLGRNGWIVFMYPNILTGI